MANAHYSCPQRLIAFSLSLYPIASLVSGTAHAWAFHAPTSAPIATAQTPIAQTPPRSSEPPPSNAAERLERARQRLIEERSTPDLPTPQTPGSFPSPPPPSRQSNVEFETYRLGPADSLFFNVLNFPALSFQTTLDLQGNVIVPLAGLVSLEGLTIEQARQLVRDQLNRFVVDPEVDVTLVAQRPVQVTVLGEVVKPGFYPLGAPELNVALFSAGGITQYADLRTIRIRRFLPDGSTLEQDVDLFTPLRDLSALPNVRLEDGDTVIVPALTPDAIATYDRNLIARSTLGQPQLLIRVLNSASGVRTGGRGSTAAVNIGSITLPSGSNFLDALTAISPNPERANLRRIALMRFDPIQGRVITQEIDGRATIMGDPVQNPPLENNDVIIIGRNLIGRITNFLNTFTEPFRDILGFLLFFDSLRDNAESLFGPGDDN